MELWLRPKAEGILTTQSLRLPHPHPLGPSTCLCFVLNIRAGDLMYRNHYRQLQELQRQTVQAAPE